MVFKSSTVDKSVNCLVHAGMHFADLFSNYSSERILKIFLSRVSACTVVLCPKYKNLVLSSNLLCIIVYGSGSQPF